MDKSSTSMRNLVRAVGGPLQEGENRKAWLARVARIADVSWRVARAAFHGEQMSLKTMNKLQQKAGIYEAEFLASRLDSYIATFRPREDADLAAVDALRGARDQLRLLGKATRDAGLIILLLPGFLL